MQRLSGTTMVCFVSLLMLELAACRQQIPVQAELKSEAKAAQLHGILWKLVESVDPYDNVPHRPDSLSGGHTFYFGGDGRFVEDIPRGCCPRTGIWSMTSDSTRLMFDFDDGSSDVSCEIREISAQRLRLGWQGRHGIVVKTYEQ